MVCLKLAHNHINRMETPENKEQKQRDIGL
jgi:hypothetical protein